ncbi:MAG: hypothetical protein GEV28_34360 [Actinophytocola sp.]|uniref:hypothetical protein n=1 Tax=Actinophytocola sp. TaxID=1872138 RepID=UPI001322FF44|nr:hypothetical protein [Actinophytocola sp.]MPZ85199.1 hypothetical protein [Actinophytocola sp.]
MRVVFHDGLFGPDGTRLTPAGRDVLRAWGRRLAGRPVTATVIGHGVPVAGGPTSGGSSVAVARAVAAARVLSDVSGLPLTAFSVTSADQSAPAHPGDGPGARGRNRTVTLAIVPGR